MNTKISRFSQLRNDLIAKGYKITEIEPGSLYIIHTKDDDYEVSLVTLNSADYRMMYAKSVFSSKEIWYYVACIQLITKDNSLSNFVFVRSEPQIARYIRLPREEKLKATYDTFKERKLETADYYRSLDQE